MKVVIADDEAPALERLRQMLEAHPQLQLVGEASSGAQAMALVAEHKPDLLVLDIQMPGGTGLDVAACLPSPRPVIIFCTAHVQHAVEAFELNAIDYVLKPVSRARLAQAIARAQQLVSGAGEEALDRAVQNQEGRLTRFLVRNGSHYSVVPAQRVSYFESVDGLTRLVTDAGQSYWVDPPLQELEGRVDPARFFRISRAALIHLEAVVEVHPFPGGAAEVALKSGVRLEVSRRRVKELLAAIEVA
jgi:two-component system LytT family response regulator